MCDDVSIKVGGPELVVRFACEIDHHTSRTLRDKLDRAIFEARPGTLVLDFSEVKFMDSAGIGLVLGRCSTCAAIGAQVRLKGLSDTLRKLVRLAGVERVRNLRIDGSPDWIYK